MSKYAYYGHMSAFDTPETEIAFLRERLDRARSEKDEALELVAEMREHLRESSDMIDTWIDVFDMQQDERGVWIYDRNQADLWAGYDELLTDYNKLIRDWNKFVPRYNAAINPKNKGRPLAASEAQAAKVKELRNGGQSLRAIANETGLSLRTVRTVLDNAEGKSRDTAKKAELRRKEFSRLRAAAFRARKRKMDSLPKELARLQKSSSKLDKQARGLGKNA